MAQAESSRAGMREHSVTVSGREKMTVTGVGEVISFDENNVVMETSAGSLTLDGNGLNITKLDLENGVVCVEGSLVGMYYIEQRGKRRLFGR